MLKWTFGETAELSGHPGKQLTSPPALPSSFLSALRLGLHSCFPDRCDWTNLLKFIVYASILIPPGKAHIHRVRLFRNLDIVKMDIRRSISGPQIRICNPSIWKTLRTLFCVCLIHWLAWLGWRVSFEHGSHMEGGVFRSMREAASALMSFWTIWTTESQISQSLQGQGSLFCNSFGEGKVNQLQKQKLDTIGQNYVSRQ